MIIKELGRIQALMTVKEKTLFSINRLPPNPPIRIEDKRLNIFYSEFLL